MAKHLAALLAGNGFESHSDRRWGRRPTLATAGPAAVGPAGRPLSGPSDPSNRRIHFSRGKWVHPNSSVPINRIDRPSTKPPAASTCRNNLQLPRQAALHRKHPLAPSPLHPRLHCYPNQVAATTRDGRSPLSPPHRPSRRPVGSCQPPANRRTYDRPGPRTPVPLTAYSCRYKRPLTRWQHLFPMYELTRWYRALKGFTPAVPCTNTVRSI